MLLEKKINIKNSVLDYVRYKELKDVIDVMKEIGTNRQQISNGLNHGDNTLICLFAYY